jgi:hypothetical protein
MAAGDAAVVELGEVCGLVAGAAPGWPFDRRLRAGGGRRRRAREVGQAAAQDGAGRADTGGVGGQRGAQAERAPASGERGGGERRDLRPLAGRDRPVGAVPPQVRRTFPLRTGTRRFPPSTPSSPQARPGPPAPDLPPRGQTRPPQQLPRQETRRGQQHPPPRAAHGQALPDEHPRSMIKPRLPAPGTGVRSYATTVAKTKGFPEPILDHPRLRLWPPTRRRRVAGPEPQGLAPADLTGCATWRSHPPTASPPLRGSQRSETTPQSERRCTPEPSIFGRMD